jgi:hypothetical protein
MWKKMPWKPKESEKGKEKSKEIPPLLHRVAKSQETHGKGLLLRLVFISDHGEPLDICLNHAQADRPAACYLYDYLMNLNQAFAQSRCYNGFFDIIFLSNRFSSRHFGTAQFHLCSFHPAWKSN